MNYVLKKIVNIILILYWINDFYSMDNNLLGDTLWENIFNIDDFIKTHNDHIINNENSLMANNIIKLDNDLNNDIINNENSLMANNIIKLDNDLNNDIINNENSLMANHIIKLDNDLNNNIINNENSLMANHIIKLDNDLNNENIIENEENILEKKIDNGLLNGNNNHNLFNNVVTQLSEWNKSNVSFTFNNLNNNSDLFYYNSYENSYYESNINNYNSFYDDSNETQNIYENILLEKNIEKSIEENNKHNKINYIIKNLCCKQNINNQKFNAFMESLDFCNTKNNISYDLDKYDKIVGTIENKNNILNLLLNSKKVTKVIKKRKYVFKKNKKK